MTGDTRSSTRWPLAVGIVAMAIASVAALCASRRPVVDPPATRTARAGYLRAHETFSHVFYRLGRRVDEDPAALHAIRHAALACQGHVSDQWMRRRGVSVSEKTFQRWQFDYCRGTSDRGWAKMYETGEWVDVRRRHPDWSIAKGATSYPPDLYATLLQDAPPADLRIAQMVLADDKGRHAPWRFGSDLVAGSRRAPGLYRYQRMALRLLECDIVGGCGRNGVLTFELCREEGDCRNGASTQSIIASRYAADEVVIIGKLHRRMVDDRLYYTRSKGRGNAWK
jgi:hypothetical protein